MGDLEDIPWLKWVFGIIGLIMLIRTAFFIYTMAAKYKGSYKYVFEVIFSLRVMRGVLNLQF